MDYPKSIAGVGLKDGKFTDGNPATGEAASLIPASWGNAVTDEILAVIHEAGLSPDESNKEQLKAAIIAIVNSKSAGVTLEELNAAIAQVDAVTQTELQTALEQTTKRDLIFECPTAKPAYSENLFQTSQGMTTSLKLANSGVLVRNDGFSFSLSEFSKIEVFAVEKHTFNNPQNGDFIIVDEQDNKAVALQNNEVKCGYVVNGNFVYDADLKRIYKVVGYADAQTSTSPITAGTHPLIDGYKWSDYDFCEVENSMIYGSIREIFKFNNKNLHNNEMNIREYYSDTHIWWFKLVKQGDSSFSYSKNGGNGLYRVWGIK